ATPLLGGAAVFVSALVAWIATTRLVAPSPVTRDVLGLLAGALGALVLGLRDDRHGMRPIVKLIGQGLAAVILLASSGAPDLHLGPIVNAAVTLVVLVALMNAVNFLDNMNGMVAGLAPIALLA